MAKHSFYPPLRTLMGPGPSEIHPEVIAALSRPAIGHLDPVFISMMTEINQQLQYAFQTQNEFTIPISAPGSAGMEACFVNLVEPGDSVIVCRNGVFGGRMLENVERCGGNAIVVDNAWGEPVDPQKVEDALRANPEAKFLAFVHAETSTGVLSDAETLCALARQYDCFTIVDAVTSLAGSPLKVDEWGIDAVYSGSQKCLSCVPGLSPLSCSPRAVEKIRSRKDKCRSWFLDLNLLMGYWGTNAKRAYHHTAPVNSLYALHESLCLLQEEGLENAWQRHQAMHDALREGLEAMGLELFVDPACRLPQLTAVTVPEGIDEAAVRAYLIEGHGMEIGAGLGELAGRIWRIGLMGHTAREENVKRCLATLGDALREQKVAKVSAASSTLVS